MSKFEILFCTSTRSSAVTCRLFVAFRNFIAKLFFFKLQSNVAVIIKVFSMKTTIYIVMLQCFFCRHRHLATACLSFTDFNISIWVASCKLLWILILLKNNMHKILTLHFFSLSFCCRLLRHRENFFNFEIAISRSTFNFR